MAFTKLPDQTYLRECFGYNPETGELWWRARPAHHFRSPKQAKTQWFNDAYKLAGSIHSQRAGIEVGINIHNARGKFLAHRIIWKWMTGDDPIDEVDHRDNDPLNNKWSNLRDATRTQNNWNTRSKRHKQGRHLHLPKGVFARYYKGRFVNYFSIIQANGERHYLGQFDTPEGAHAAYAGACKHFHGEWGNAGHQLDTERS